MVGMASGHRRVCVYYDVENSTSRDNLSQFDAQSRLEDVIQGACAAASLVDGTYDLQRQGDGGLALLPTGAGIDEPRMIVTFLDALRIGLADSNRRLASDQRMRLRVALHEGVVHTSPHGYVGDAITEGKRLCDAAPVRQALTDNAAADLVVVAADWLYQDVLRHGYHGMPRDAFVRHPVRVKLFSGHAWIYVPGGAVAPPANAADSVADPAAAPSPAAPPVTAAPDPATDAATDPATDAVGESFLRRALRGEQHW